MDIHNSNTVSFGCLKYPVCNNMLLLLFLMIDKIDEYIFLHSSSRLQIKAVPPKNRIASNTLHSL